jgi:Plasmid stability protein
MHVVWFPASIDMGILVIKNLPDDVHERLKRRAARNHRSLTGEAIALLEAAVRSPADETDPAALEALFAAGDELKAQGMDFGAWVAASRDAWR